MDIPMNAEAYCADGLCGHSAYIIVNPISRQVTHLVVKERTAPHTERLVPVRWVMETPLIIQRINTISGIVIVLLMCIM